VATLRIPLLRRGAEVEIGGRKLTLEPSGLIGTSVAVRDTATGEERTRIAREKLHRVLELGGQRTEWRSLGWGSSYGFVGPDGEPLVRGKVSAGLTRTKGEIEVSDSLPEREALLAAALTAYLLIRRAEDNASAAAGSVAATSGGG
ncbi:MAG TPA: hypothetical protein VLK24_10635, partial [Gaiellaceae bacterium]|nr:hypothetical protein [Gaiellaceae bacterium]